jgi:hypothetical protein
VGIRAQSRFVSTYYMPLNLSFDKPGILKRYTTARYI